MTLRLVLCTALAAALIAAPAAHAAPTCQTVGGDTARCGTAGAMPVGWTPSAEQQLQRQSNADDGPSAGVLVDLVCVIGGIFALIALMPPFDGSKGGDWGDHEPDDG